MATITLKELGAQYKGIYSVKADTPRGRIEKAFEDLEAGDEVLIDNHFVEIVESFEELEAKAIEIIDNDDDIFVECVDELDSYNGFADGWRAYDMAELDDLFCGCSLSEFLEKITSDFDIRDNYFCDTIWGIESCDDKAEYYRDHTTAEEILENFYNEYQFGHVTAYDSELEEILDKMQEAEQREADEEESEEE